MKKLIDTLIAKWRDKETDLLDYYRTTPKLSENEKLFLRSEINHVGEFIENLEELKDLPL